MWADAEMAEEEEDAGGEGEAAGGDAGEAALAWASAEKKSLRKLVVGLLVNLAHR